MREGKVVSVQGPIVDVEFSSEGALPAVYEIINTETFDGQRIVLEVVEYLNSADTDAFSTVRCISLTSNVGLRRNAPAMATGSTINIPVGDATCSRILNVLGEPIDKKGPINAGPEFLRPTHKKQKIPDVDMTEGKETKFEVMPTGIKIFDFG